jgi:hypothetical protein
MRPRSRMNRVSPFQLGTVLQRALSAIGVTEERVKDYIGECGCRNRVNKLNHLSDWGYNLLLRLRKSPDDESIKDDARKELERHLSHS